MGGSGPYLSLRERKKRTTRRALEHAALELFLERGFEGTTVRQIAERADVSPRTFFRYFGNKEEVVFALETEDRRILVTNLNTRPPDETDRTALREALLAFSQHYQDDLENRMPRARSIATSPSLRQRQLTSRREWAIALVNALAQRGGEHVPSLRTRLLATSAVNALGVALEMWADGSGENSLPALTAQALDLLYNGLA
jgi:AcrR family transcriptional regulator